jgi:hypothetical protein
MVEIRLPEFLDECPQYWQNCIRYYNQKDLDWDELIKIENITFKDLSRGMIVYFQDQDHLDYFKIKWSLGNVSSH